MQHSVAAIRAGRTRTRFAAHSANHLERQLGLRRATRPALAPAQARRTRSQPLAALRRAVRGLHPATRRTHVAAFNSLTSGSLVSWCRQSSAGRRNRATRAVPWLD